MLHALLKYCVRNDVTLDRRGRSWQISNTFIDCKMLAAVQSGAPLKYTESLEPMSRMKMCLIKSMVLGNLVTGSSVSIECRLFTDKDLSHVA